MVSWHGFIFTGIERFWRNLRIFCYYNRTIFEIGFICLYSIEQAGLVWFTFRIEDLKQLQLIVAMFAIIVLTTFALHKVLMESRIKVLEDELQGVVEDKKELELKTKSVQNSYNDLLEGIKRFKYQKIK